jgi:CRP-like cAMP-binding protein
MSDDLSPYLVKVSKGTVLFREGDSGEEMYFVHGGKVRIEKEISGTTEVLAVMEKGDFFGEMSLLDHVPRTATVVIEEDAELLKVDAANFQKLLQGNIEIAVRMIRKYTARLRDANAKFQAAVQDRSDMDKEIQEILKAVKAPTQPEAVAPPVATELALLVGEEKEMGSFSLSKPTVLIGRRDPVTNLMPDVDLSAVDPDRSVSRRHARMQLVDGQFLLTEEPGVANGTYVGGKRIVPGRPVPVKNGNRVSFGKVSFKFQTKNLKN